MKSIVIQKAFVVNNEGKVLAIKRSETDDRRPLQWDLPGGWLDEGETLERGIIREVKEETGVVAENPRLVFTKTATRTWVEGDDAKKKGNCIFLFYAVEATIDSVTLSYEHVAYEWMKLEDAIKVFTYELHSEALMYVLENELI